MQKRLIIKISGESITDRQSGLPINPLIVSDYAKQIVELANAGWQIGIVFGGGNIWRGWLVEELGIDRISGDYMGMLATVINSQALKGALIKRGHAVKLMNAFHIEHVGEVLEQELANKYLDEGNIVIFGAGTGQPYVSTDTGAALRAVDIGAKLILFGKNGTDGVYTKDPNKNKDAEFISKMTYKEMVERHIAVIDAAAVDLCDQFDIESRIFNVDHEKAFENALNKKGKFTSLTHEE